MQHIVQIAFDFDDERARDITNAAIEKEVHKIIEEMVLDKYAPKKNSIWSNATERDYTRLHDTFNDICRIFLDEHKDEIIENAATKLAESYKRTKVWKEKAGEVVK